MYAIPDAALAARLPMGKTDCRCTNYRVFVSSSFKLHQHEHTISFALEHLVRVLLKVNSIPWRLCSSTGPAAISTQSPPTNPAGVDRID